MIWLFIGPESDHWQCLSLTHSLTHSLLISKLDWCDVWLVKMPTQNLLRLLLLLVLILRSWSLVMKTNFCPDFGHKILAKDFEAEVKSIFCCWPLVAIMTIILGRDSEAMFGQDFEDEIWSRFVWELVIWPKEVTLVTRTQPSGPLCLWQCF